MPSRAKIKIHDATDSRWPDFESLMGPKGGCGGCWCMLWRRGAKAFDAGKGEPHHQAMRQLFHSTPAPGVLAYDGDVPVGWCSVAPRAAFPRLEGSRVLKPVDTADVWSISCFLVAKSHRRQGVSVALLDAAVAFAGRNGGQIVEGYPVAPEREKYPPVYAWVGFHDAFLRAGFTEVARRAPTRPIMRRACK